MHGALLNHHTWYDIFKALNYTMQESRKCLNKFNKKYTSYEILYLNIRMTHLHSTYVIKITFISEPILYP